MTTDMLDSGDWPNIVQRIRDGDPTVGAHLAERERRFDNFFGVISRTDTTPGAILQGAVERNVVYHDLWGYRIGNWVHLKGTAEIDTLVAQTGRITVEFPEQLPFDQTEQQDRNTLGILVVYDDSHLETYFGEARRTYATGPDGVTLTDQIYGWASGIADQMGNASPGAALAVFDKIRYEISYRTPNLLV
jgi:hypothetical protein